jgi:hypothetical protein
VLIHPSVRLRVLSPELRAVWMAVAVSVALLTPENFEGFYSDVTTKCMTNGTFYYSICGPRGAEQLPFHRWSAIYTGYQEYDLDIVQAYAGLLKERSETIGASANGKTGALMEDAANAWFEREPTLPETEQAARFYHDMCKLWRDSKAGESDQDEPQRFADFASGSIEHITSSWAYETCKKSKQRVFGDASRAIHSLGLEIGMCLEVRVHPTASVCLRAADDCAGVCAGPRRVQEEGGAVPRLDVGRPHGAHELRLCHRRRHRRAQPRSARRGRLLRRRRQLHAQDDNHRGPVLRGRR